MLDTILAIWTDFSVMVRKGWWDMVAVSLFHFFIMAEEVGAWFFSIGNPSLGEYRRLCSCTRGGR